MSEEFADGHSQGELGEVLHMDSEVHLPDMHHPEHHHDDNEDTEEDVGTGQQQQHQQHLVVEAPPFPDLAPQQHPQHHQQHQQGEEEEQEGDHNPAALAAHQAAVAVSPLQAPTHPHPQHVVRQGKGRRSWTAHEDQQLMEIVSRDGTTCWSAVAACLEGRVGKQCRERWRNHLDPSIRRDPFTPEEDERILELVQELGTKWSKIAQRLPGRTENAVKNRYHCFLKNRGANAAKRARDEAGAALGLPQGKRAHADKQSSYHQHHVGDDGGVVGVEGADGGVDGKADGSLVGTFACGLLGCGRQYAQLSHLLAHRLTHFADGRHPSALHPPSAPSVAMVGDQRLDPAPDTTMLVRALDGLVDDLLSQVQAPRVHAHAHFPHHDDAVHHEHHDHHDHHHNDDDVHNEVDLGVPGGGHHHVHHPHHDAHHDDGDEDDDGHGLVEEEDALALKPGEGHSDALKAA